MRRKSALMGIAVTLAFAVLSPTIARACLLGSEVTGALFFPNETTFCNSPGICSSPIGPVPVTSGVPPEFPAGSLAFDGSLAVSDSQIIWTATLAETYQTGTASKGGGAFNGFQPNVHRRPNHNRRHARLGQHDFACAVRRVPLI
jgi:hypothetical protein